MPDSTHSSTESKVCPFKTDKTPENNNRGRITIFSVNKARPRHFSIGTMAETDRQTGVKNSLNSVVLTPNVDQAAVGAEQRHCC